jgi:hypothetical protein
VILLSTRMRSRIRPCHYCLGSRRIKGNNPAEVVEGRGVAKGNTEKTPASRTQSRNSRASMGLEGVREAARRDRRLRFTALLQHITAELLTESFYALRRQAAAGVDGVTWQEYETVHLKRLPVMRRKIHTGSFRAQSRPVLSNAEPQPPTDKSGKTDPTSATRHQSKLRVPLRA